MLAGLASFPVAQLWVTRSGKYNAGPFNSQALEQAQRTELEVQP